MGEDEADSVLNAKGLVRCRVKREVVSVCYCVESCLCMRCLDSEQVVNAQKKDKKNSVQEPENYPATHVEEAVDWRKIFAVQKNDKVI